MPRFAFENLIEEGVLNFGLNRKLYFLFPVQSEINTVIPEDFVLFNLDIDSDGEKKPIIDVSLENIAAQIPRLYDRIHEKYCQFYPRSTLEKEETKLKKELIKQGKESSYILPWLSKKKTILKDTIKKTIEEIIEECEYVRNLKEINEINVKRLLDNIRKKDSNKRTSEELSILSSYINLYLASCNKIVSKILKEKQEKGDIKIFDEIFKYNVVVPIFEEINSSLSKIINSEIPVPKLPDGLEIEINPKLFSFLKPGISLVSDVDITYDEKIAKKTAMIIGDLDYDSFLDIQNKIMNEFTDINKNIDPVSTERIIQFLFGSEILMPKTEEEHKIANLKDREARKIKEIILNKDKRQLPLIKNLILYSPKIIEHIIPDSDEKKEYLKVARQLRKANLLNLIYEHINIIPSRFVGEISKKRFVYDFSIPEEFSNLEMSLLSADAKGSSKELNRDIIDLNNAFIIGENSLLGRKAKLYGGRFVSSGTGDNSILYFKGKFHSICALLTGIDFLKDHEKEKENPEVKKLRNYENREDSCGIYSGKAPEFLLFQQHGPVQHAAELGKSEINLDKEGKEKYDNGNSLIFGLDESKREENFIEKLTEELRLLQIYYEKYKNDKISDGELKTIFYEQPGLYEKLKEMRNRGIIDITISPFHETKEKEEIRQFYLMEISEKCREFNTPVTEKIMKDIDNLVFLFTKDSLYSPLFSPYPFAKKMGNAEFDSGTIPFYKVFYTEQEFKKEVVKDAKRKALALENRLKRKNVGGNQNVL